MNILDFFVFFSAFLVVLTKFFDCFSTALRIQSIHDEQNPIARKLMNKIGVNTTIWLVFFVYILIVLLSIFLLFYCYNTTFWKALFITLAFLISVIQAAIAHSNYFGKFNRISTIILILFNKLSNFLSKWR